MSSKVRPLTADDRKDWEELWKGYQEFYGADLSADTDRLFNELLAAKPEGPLCLVYEDEGRLLGIVHYLYHQTCWGPEPRCYLNDLFTAPKARGKGVGRALIEAVYNAADTAGAAQVYWLTQDFNEAARRLYDKLATKTPFIKYVR